MLTFYEIHGCVQPTIATYVHDGHVTTILLPNCDIIHVGYSLGVLALVFVQLI